MLFWCSIFLFIIICVLLTIVFFWGGGGLLGLSILVSIICSHGNYYFQFSVFFHVNVSLFFFYFFDPFVDFLLVFCG